MRQVRGAVVAWTVLALVLSGCATDVLTLSVGDCFQDEDVTAANGDTREVSEVPLVDCEEPHDNQVYAVLDLPDGDYPHDVADLARQECEGTRFSDYVGGASQPGTEFSSLAFWPTEDGWGRGDREVICYLYRTDLQRMTGSQQGVGVAAASAASAEASSPDAADGGATAQSVFALQSGDCFQDQEDFLDDAAQVSSISLVDCGQPHDHQVYGVVNLPDGAFPEDVAARAREACSGEMFTDYVGVPLTGSGFSVLPIYPTAQSWAEGDREVVCALYRDDLAPMVGSQKRPGAG